MSYNLLWFIFNKPHLLPPLCPTGFHSRDYNFNSYGRNICWRTNNTWIQIDFEFSFFLFFLFFISFSGKNYYLKFCLINLIQVSFEQLSSNKFFSLRKLKNWANFKSIFVTCILRFLLIDPEDRLPHPGSVPALDQHWLFANVDSIVRVPLFSRYLHTI